MTTKSILNEITMTTTGFYLLLAILLEVAGTTSMKLAEGFHNLVPSIFIFVFYAFSFIFLTLTLRRLELSFVYAVWSGLGTSLIVIVGMVFFHEPMTLVKFVSLGFIVFGIMGLRLG